MKKLFITALFAILMGGFTLTANAQFEASDVNLKKQNVESSEQAVKNDKKIADYQNAVTKFVTDFDAWKEGIGTDKINLKKDKETADGLRSQIEAEFEKLTPTQKETVKGIHSQYDTALRNYDAFLKKQGNH